jgi:sarcosine oxidase/L-pipecolate oxidase
VTAAEIEKRYPFTNLPKEWEGVLAPDNGIIDVQLLVRALLRLARDYGARAQQNVEVKSMSFGKHQGQEVWTLKATKADSSSVEYYGKKIVITPGAYANHVLQPSFEFSLDLDIWEMVATYFNVNAGPQASIFPSTPSTQLITTLH